MSEVFPGGAIGREPACHAGVAEVVDSVPSWEDPLEEVIAHYSSIVAWKILWTEEPGRLQSMGWLRVGHD